MSDTMSYKETTELFDVLGDHHWCNGDMLFATGNFLHKQGLLEDFKEYLQGTYSISEVGEIDDDDDDSDLDEDDSAVESNDDDEEENEPVYGEYNITLYEESL